MGVPPRVALLVWREFPASHLPMRCDLPRKRERCSEVDTSTTELKLSAQTLLLATLSSACLMDSNISLICTAVMISGGQKHTASADVACNHPSFEGGVGNGERSIAWLGIRPRLDLQCADQADAAR